MSQEAVGTDLMQILRMFTSPTMGRFSNTNATPQFPPGSDEARAQSDPARFGGGQQPAPGALPPGFPQPVRRRVVADPETTGAISPAPTGTPPAATGQVAQAAPTAGVPDFVANDPSYQAYAAQIARRRHEAIQDMRLQNAFSGFAEAAAALTGGEVKSGGGAAAAKLPTADLTLDQFQEFQKRHQATLDRAEDNKRIDTIVADPRMAGVTKEVLLSLRENDPKAYAKIVGDYFSGETDTKVDPTTGAIVSRPKYGKPDAPFTTVYRSPETEAKASADLAKTKAETVKTGAEVEKVKADTIKVQQSLADPAKANSPEVIQQVADVLNVSYETAAAMPIPDRVDALIKVRTSAETQAGGERVKIAGKRVEDAQSTITTAQQNIAERAMRRGVLARGDVITGYPGAEFEGKVRAFVSGGLDEKEARTRAYLALSASDVLRAGEKMKGAFSDKDREFLEMARAGGRQLNASEMQRVLALQDLIDRKQLNAGVTARSKGRAAIGQDDLDGQDDRPGAMQPHEMKVIRADLLREALDNPGGRKYFETVYGKEIADEAIQRAQEVAATKVSGPELQTYNAVPLDELKANRAALNDAMVAKYGDDADGVINLVIAQREKAAK